ncbi:MAG: hypothetical protein MJ072_02725, partial [Clostridia bacterium]|nr:hypothetical protein [Clostridia bacterium]
VNGLKYGDTIEVYKDGKFVGKKLYSSVYDAPSFSDGGQYRVVITNLAGVSTEFTFTKKYVANTATSVVIIIGCLVAAAVVLIGLLYRNRSKTDR